MPYEQRLLLFADILGWSDKIHHGDSAPLLEAMKVIDERAQSYNERSRQERRAADGKVIDTAIGLRRVSPNPMSLKIQFGAFSDNFCHSVPDSFGARILDHGSTLILDLMHLGFLTRGAVVHGALYHQDNAIFGPALLEAVEIEKREAFYPRILVTKAVIDHCRTLGHLDNALVIQDQTGRFVVNPFVMPFDGPDDTLESFVDLNFRFPRVKSILELQISSLEGESRYRHAEKWRYMREFIDGPVMNAAPKLRRYWNIAV